MTIADVKAHCESRLRKNRFLVETITLKIDVSQIVHSREATTARWKQLGLLDENNQVDLTRSTYVLKDILGLD